MPQRTRRAIWLTTLLLITGATQLGVHLYEASLPHDQIFKKPNHVILIVVDTLRADHVSALGYSRATTPALTHLAKTEAVRFARAYAPSSWTLPSTISLFTSLHPHQHQVEDRGKRLHPEVPTLAGAFSTAGWRSAAFITHIYASSRFGCHAGFDEFHELSIDWQYREGKQLRADELNREVLPWLTKNKDTRFLAYLHYFDPHWDYDPPPPFHRRFTDPTYRGPATGTWRFIKPFISKRRQMSNEDLAHVVALYDGEIAYTDHHLEQLFAHMKRLGIWDDALVVVLSDHGEEFQDHGSMHHIRTLYEEVLHVPLLIKLPSGKKSIQRPIVPERVRTLDVGPTLLELAGIDPMPTAQGESLLPLIHRRGSYRDVFARTMRHKSDAMALIHRTHKLIVPFGRKKTLPQLYNLVSDPKESKNLISRHPDLYDRLETRLHRFSALDGAALGLSKPIGDVSLTEGQKAHLKALGYVE
ncbi:MAG: sulfatase [Myxococcota bacterium]|nr:sulfatase [Myxococcota bacterium]